MKRNVAIALAVLFTLVLSVYCYSQSSQGGREVALSHNAVKAQFAKVSVKKEGDRLISNADRGIYASVIVFEDYNAFENHIKGLQSDFVPIVFEITTSPTVTLYAVATGSCRMQAGKLICQ